MKFSKIVISLLVSSIIFTGCGKDEEKDTSTRDDSSQQNEQNIEEQEANERMGDVTKQNRGKMLWSYKFSEESYNFSQVPAIDEKGNIYFAFNSRKDKNKKERALFVVTSLDKNGKKRWSKRFENSSGNLKVVYQNHKIFVVVTDKIMTGNISEPKITIYAFNSSDGEVKWSTNEKNSFHQSLLSPAISNNKLYIGIGQELLSFDLENGQKKDSYEIDGNLLYSMAIFDKHIYFFKDDCLVRLDDVENKITKNWEICKDSFTEKDNYEKFFTNREGAGLAIDSQENIYFNSSKINKYSAVYSLDKYGEFRWRKEMDSTRVRFGEGLTIDKNDNIYSTVPGDRTKRGYLYSLSSEGDENWRLDNSYFDDTKILEMGYQSSPTIGSNGNIYNKVEYGLNSVKSNGTLDWKHQSDNGELVVSSYSTINTDGNIIAIGLGRGVACYKGDGTTLESNGWSKLYGNTGNTSSR